MWTHKITGKEENDTRILVYVDYSNGAGKTLSMSHGASSLGQLKSAISNKIKELEAYDVTKAELLNLPDGEAIDLTPALQPTPTAEQVAREKFNIDKEKFKDLAKLVETGALAADNQTYRDLKTSIASRLKSEYYEVTQ